MTVTATKTTKVDRRVRELEAAEAKERVARLRERAEAGLAAEQTARDRADAGRRAAESYVAACETLEALAPVFTERLAKAAEAAQRMADLRADIRRHAAAAEKLGAALPRTPPQILGADPAVRSRIAGCLASLSQAGGN